MPLLFLHNITGYIVGTDFEQQGITKNGSKMINAVSNSTVPHITVIVGAMFSTMFAAEARCPGGVVAKMQREAEAAPAISIPPPSSSASDPGQGLSPKLDIEA